MWPDWAIYCTLGNFLKPVATIILPKSPTFLGNYGKGGKIFHFHTDIIYWPTFIDIWRLFTGHTGCVVDLFGANKFALPPSNKDFLRKLFCGRKKNKKIQFKGDLSQSPFAELDKIWPKSCKMFKTSFRYIWHYMQCDQMVRLFVQ